MDGENHGKPYFWMDDFGGTIIFGNTHLGKNMDTQRTIIFFAVKNGGPHYMGTPLIKKIFNEVMK